MGQLTIRNLDPQIESKIRRMAKKSGKSINHIILEMIYGFTGHTANLKAKPCVALRKLAGGWDDKDEAEFCESIKPCEQIDEEMWR